MKNRFQSLLVIFSIFTFGCNPEEVQPEDEHSIELEGKYDLISMTSEIAVDLDRDGNFSKDILAEISKSLKSPNPVFL